MGTAIDRTEFSARDHANFARKLQQNLDALKILLARPGFGVGPASIGAEVELFIIDARFLPLLDVTTSPLRAKFAVASLVLLVILILLSVFRQRLRMSYALWKSKKAILTTEWLFV